MHYTTYTSFYWNVTSQTIFPLKGIDLQYKKLNGYFVTQKI